MPQLYPMKRADAVDELMDQLLKPEFIRRTASAGYSEQDLDVNLDGRIGIMDSILSAEARASCQTRYDNAVKKIHDAVMAYAKKHMEQEVKT